MIDANILKEETLQTISESSSTVYAFKIIFITEDGSEISPLSLLNVHYERNCEDKWFDGVKAVVCMGLGSFNSLAKHKGNLMARLITTPVANTKGDIKSIPIKTRLFRAVIDESPTGFKQGQYTGREDGDLDLTNSVEFTVQLIDLAVEKIKHSSAGGILHNMTIIDALRYFLGTSKSISLPAEAEIKGVDSAKVTGNKIWNDIVVKHGTNLTKLVGFLKKHYYGMYPTGTGWYYYKNHWYLYPRINTDGSAHTGKKVVILNLPKDRFKGIENTYTEDRETIKILCTGNSNFKDNTTGSNYNVGTGIRYFDPERLDNNFGEYVDGKYVVDRNSNLSEFSVSNSKTKDTHASFHPDIITADIESSIGNIYMSTLQHVSLVWENSSEESIRPGMSGIYIQEDISGVFGHHCTVIKSFHTIDMVGSKIQDERYASQSVLVVVLGDLIK